jgi:hypothetical protein
LGATSAGGQARVIAYAYGNADLKKLNEATVLASRQAGQVNELERDWRKRRQIVPIASIYARLDFWMAADLTV